MNPQEIDIGELTLPQLTKICQDEVGVALLISYVLNLGIKLERERLLRVYNEAFRGYNKVSIEN